MIKTLLTSSFASLDEEEAFDDDDDDSDASFHYPGSSSEPIASSSNSAIRNRAPSVGSHSTDYFNRPTISRTSTDLTPHLSQASDFRVPTHETPQKVLAPRRDTPTPHSLHAEWERDETVSDCRGCKRRFTFLFRKVRVRLNLEGFKFDLLAIACK